MELDFPLLDLLVKMGFELNPQSFELIFLSADDLLVLVLPLLFKAYTPLLSLQILCLLQVITSCFRFLVVPNLY